MHVHVYKCIMTFWKHIFYELASFRYFSCILSVYEIRKSMIYCFNPLLCNVVK